MPYIVRPRRFPSGAVAACTALLVFGAASAQAATSPAKETSQCTEPTLTQPFLYAGDSNYYVLAPGAEPWQLRRDGVDAQRRGVDQDDHARKRQHGLRA